MYAYCLKLDRHRNLYPWPCLTCLHLTYLSPSLSIFSPIPVFYTCAPSGERSPNPPDAKKEEKKTNAKRRWQMPTKISHLNYIRYMCYLCYLSTLRKQTKHKKRKKKRKKKRNFNVTISTAISRVFYIYIHIQNIVVDWMDYGY
jgi:hypothetical protein